jgi:primosomal protein N' (replication factor Y)
MALLIRAARLVGPRERGGRIIIQTFVPRHEVVLAAQLADPGRIVDAERQRRQMLALPPYGAYGEVSGVGSDEFVASIPPSEGVVIVGGDGTYAVKADDWMTMGRALTRGVRPPGSRLRIAVDPPR